MSRSIGIKDSNVDNNCNLVGVEGILVQIILILLIFTAVKCKHVLLTDQ